MNRIIKFQNKTNIMLKKLKKKNKNHKFNINKKVY